MNSLAEARRNRAKFVYGCTLVLLLFIAGLLAWQGNILGGLFFAALAGGAVILWSRLKWEN